MRVPRILALVLAGGKGSRLEALTADRPKPTLPIGGNYSLIDVSMSNLAHSHIRDVWMIEQFRADRLNTYIDNGRPWDLDRTNGGLVVVPPVEGGHGEGFAQGNADALARQLKSMREFAPEHVLVLSADHLYQLNFLDVFDTHEEREADLTIVTTEQSGDVSRYGVVELAADATVTDFAYKPEGRRDGTVVTEVFLYRAESLFTALDTLLEDHDELSDYGDELLPHFIEHQTVVAHDLGGYWMDLGTIQSYWAANLQLVDGAALDLDDRGWPLFSAQPQRLSARVGDDAEVSDALVAPGTRVDGRVEHSVIGVGAVVAAGAQVVDSVLLDEVRIETGVRLRNCVVAPGAHLTGPAEFGRDGNVTLIGSDGAVSSSEEFDSRSPVPRLTRADR